MQTRTRGMSAGSPGGAISHAFVIPAYGNSPFLEQCLSSLAAQSRRSEIIVCTSTPFDGLDALCERYAAKVVRHGPNQGIAHDWNTALASTTAEWVTIAHQDDVYLPVFAERSLALVQRYPDAIMVFTGYAEAHAKGPRSPSMAMWIKRALVEAALFGRRRAPGRVSKTNLLRFGCPIGCPAVSLRVGAIPEQIRFDGRYRVNLDWDFWLRLAQQVPGSFLCERKVLMHHRIHEASETTAGIVDGARAREDYELFTRMWPHPMAKLLARAYRLSYSYNKS